MGAVPVRFHCPQDTAVLVIGSLDKPRPVAYVEKESSVTADLIPEVVPCSADNLIRHVHEYLRVLERFTDALRGPAHLRLPIRGDGVLEEDARVVRLLEQKGVATLISSGGGDRPQIRIVSCEEH